MRLRDARIGYAGYSRDFSAPGDRRRFCTYAAHRRIAYERAELGHRYDVVLVTHNSDIAGWTKRKQREVDGLKFIFELADSYFTQTGLLRRVLKGAARYALGIDSRLSPDFLRTLIRACESADAVICSTDEQREVIRRYNPNVFVSFDHFGEELGSPKADYTRSGKLKIVWEGQSTTLPNLQVIREPLNDLKDKVELHVVTDPRVYRYFGRFLPYRSQGLLKGIECDVRLSRWDRTSFARLVTSADVAVIPIDCSNRFAAGKPENKLVMLWQLGMPALTSPTPAYLRAMEAADVDMTCATSAEWGRWLERLIAADESELQRIGNRCRTFAERAYSKEEFLSRFDQAFEAVGLSPDQASSSRYTPS